MDLIPGTPRFDFEADLGYLAETKFKANLSRDAEGWIEQLWGEYEAAGSPKQRKKWITEGIQNEFKSMKKPPAWLNMDNSKWPFHKNKPMVFIAQVRLESTPATAALLDEGSETYLFGIKDIDGDGCTIMVYEEVTLFRF